MCTQDYFSRWPAKGSAEREDAKKMEGKGERQQRVADPPQQIGDMVLFLSQIVHSLTVDEVRKQLWRKWAADPDVSVVERQRAYSLLDSPIELSSSSLRKNVKSLYRQFEIEPEIVVHPKCPTLECQNVLYDVVSHKGFDKVPASCPDCDTCLKGADGKLLTESFPFLGLHWDPSPNTSSSSKDSND